MKMGLEILVLVLLSWMMGDIHGDNTTSAKDYIASKEAGVQQIAGNAANFATGCDVQSCFDHPSRLSCSPQQGDLTSDSYKCMDVPINPINRECSAHSNQTCAQMFLNFKESFVRLPPPFNGTNLSSELVESICVQHQLDGTFSNLASSKDSLVLTAWHYFGSVGGDWRVFPGRETNPDGNCRNYDPRKRPWYVGATSVVKDLVVLLDTGQTSDDTFAAAQHAVIELFDTFAANDSVNVVTFDSFQAASLASQSISVQTADPTSTSSVSHPELDKLVQGVSTLQNKMGGYSNISQAFQQALSTFSADSLLKIIVVFTDGNFAASPEYPNQKLHVIALLTMTNVTVFFYSLSPGNTNNAEAELQILSCLVHGSYTSVNVSDVTTNPLWAIRSYFDYNANLHFQNDSAPYWTPTYRDFDYIGNVSTVAYPAFDEEKRLIGVAGIDVIMYALEGLSADVEALVKDKVKLNGITVSGSKLPCPQTAPSALCNGDPGTTQPLLNQTDFGTDSTSLYLERLCCGSCKLVEPTSVGGKGWSVGAILGLTAGLLLGVFMMYLLAWFQITKKERSSLRELKEELSSLSIQTTLFTYKELKVATRGFHHENKLGEGGFGIVYKDVCLHFLSCTWYS